MSKRILSALALVTLLSCNTAKNSTRLAFNFPKGKVYEYNMTMDMTQEAQGQKGTTSMKAAYLMEVTGEQDSLKTIRTTFDHIGMDMNMPGMQLHIDSEEPDSSGGAKLNMEAMGDDPGKAMQSMMGGMFRAMKGKSFTMKMNREGKVLAVEGMQALADDMANGMNVADELKGAVQQSFSSQFDETKMMQTFQAYYIYPDKAVKVGDSWVRESTASGVNMRNTYTVRSVEGGKVTLDVKGDIGNDSVKGTQTGTLLIEQATGLIISGNMLQHFEGAARIDNKVTYSGREK
ncbi:DUF6263 family protein [Flaviaesturariibacter terrae]